MSLKQRAFEAGRWTAASALAVTGLQFLQTVVLARLLVPAEFGLMAIVASLLAVASLFADMGMSRALVHFDQLSRDALSSVYWLNLGTGILLALLFALVAPVVAGLFDSPALAPVLQVAGLLFPLVALGQQFRVLAEKELRFGVLAATEVAASLAGIAAALGVAVSGGGVYALVAGILVRAATSSLLAWLLLSAGRRPSWHLHFPDVRPFIRFGSYLVGDNLANTLHRQSDIFIGGLVASPAGLGMFAVPRDLSYRVAIVINPILTRVGFPVMAMVKDDREKLGSIYLQSLRMGASVNFPLYLGLALFADDAVLLFYGPQWVGAGAYLRILALWGLARSIGNPVGSLLYATGSVRLACWWNVSLLAVVPPLLWLAARAAGLLGLSWALLAIQVAVIVPAWRLLVSPLCGATLGQYTSAFLMPLALSAAAVGAGALAAEPASGPVARLGVGFVVSAGAYLALSHRFNRAWSDAMRELLHLPARRR